MPLKEGMNDVKIEVTAEDGTVKNYMIHTCRLSSKDATLSDLKISAGTLNPEFSPDVIEYSCKRSVDYSSVLNLSDLSDLILCILCVYCIFI